MRIGQNPAKFVKEVAQPARVTVAVLNYIPFLSGYYADMLNVLDACLTSIWENTDLDYDLMVFDNGSCEEVIEYLARCSGCREDPVSDSFRKEPGQGRRMEHHPFQCAG